MNASSRSPRAPPPPRRPWPGSADRRSRRCPTARCCASCDLPGARPVAVQARRPACSTSRWRCRGLGRQLNSRHADDLGEHVHVVQVVHLVHRRSSSLWAEKYRVMRETGRLATSHRSPFGPQDRTVPTGSGRFPSRMVAGLVRSRHADRHRAMQRVAPVARCKTQQVTPHRERTLLA
jgi:hypothetical protein